jgi:serine protease SohB
MLEFLYEYGLFLAKTVTFLIAFVYIITAIISAKQKSGINNGQLTVTSLNEEHDETLKDVQSITLSKQELKEWNKKHKNKKKKKEEKRLFVFNFDGDIKASETESLVKIVNTLISVHKKGDEVLCVLESGGGMVHSYGLAAAELARLKEHKIHLTVAVDKVAASGGYLMACVANKIIASPFAVIGSIGVLAQIPNFHRLLDKNNIDFEQITAGEYKRTLTIFGENTEKGRAKLTEEVQKTHDLFKDAVSKHRPQMDMAKIATGEHWHGTQAYEYKLVDSICTSQEYINSKLDSYKSYLIEYQEERSISDKFLEKFSLKIENIINKFLFRKREDLF